MMEHGRIYRISGNKQESVAGVVSEYRSGYERSDSEWGAHTTHHTRTCSASSHWKCVLVVTGVIVSVASIILILALPLWLADDTSTITTTESSGSDSSGSGLITTPSVTEAAVTEETGCGEGAYQCRDGVCISERAVCDDRQDCSGGEEEEDCVCRGFECVDGSRCLAATERCDTYQQCADGSDEAGCGCSDYESSCPDGACIMLEWLCDGVPDCADGADEIGCASVPCVEAEFLCADYSACINGSQRCDGVAQCPDASDESLCVQISETDVLLLTQGDITVPVCAAGWNEQLSQTVCSHLSAGIAVSTGYISNITSNSSDSHLYALLKEGQSEYNTSILSLFENSTSTTCDTNTVVTISCSYDECGTRARDFKKLNRRKIINGRTATPGEWPWHVMLLYSGTLICGATLIAPEWVVTAAHCLERAPEHPSRFSFMFGTLSIDSKAPIRIAEQLILHEDYDTLTLENDIALVKLKEPITYSDFIRPICLPATDYNFYTDVECFTIGSGAIDSQASIKPKYLQMAKMLLIEDRICAEEPDIAEWGLYENLMLCAGYLHGFKTVCTGDSGSALVCRDENDQWKLAGVTSWGPVDSSVHCKGLSVFSEVTYFNDWINNKLL